MSLTHSTGLMLRPGIQIVAFDSSTQEKSFRVELTDGRHFQINERLYHLLESLRTGLTVTELAEAFQARTGNMIALDQLTALCTQLLEKGLINQEGDDLSQPVTPVTPKAYLGMHFRRTLLSAERLAPLAALFQHAFRWPVAIPLLTLVAVAHFFAYRALSLQPSLQLEHFTGPLLAFLLLISIVLHEIGHVAACRRWGCPHGPLGFGLYFAMPVFYVDVTQAWRLTRRQRAAVDVGGVYIQLLSTPLAMLFYWWTGDPTFLMVILAVDMLVLYNFEPFMKLDGYWLLSDLTGVPNLHNRTSEAALNVGKWLLRKLKLANPAPMSSPFSQWSWWVRTIIWIYLAISTLIWPLFIIAWLPMIWQSLLAYPALLYQAVVGLATATVAMDFNSIFAQLGILFMPTLIMVALSFELKRGVTKLQQGWQQRRTQTSPLPTAPATA